MSSMSFTISKIPIVTDLNEFEFAIIHLSERNKSITTNVIKAVGNQ